MGDQKTCPNCGGPLDEHGCCKNCGVCVLRGGKPHHENLFHNRP
ncbi:hypothetical protein ES703_06158 [subsurface metagenome]